ncbi:MAG: DUF2207 domain-containing protein [Lachnospiraceae bacterium]|nr:DUF2207 domain-containing protein [Lachnospiraceae bacterium]
MLDAWDVDASFDDKSYTCGILPTEDGYELCFGISQYGHRVYRISYTVDHVVGSYEDADGVNFRFINDQMNTTPTNADVRITLWDGTPITDDICDIWAFGYDGQVAFDDDSIYAYTEKALEKDNHMTIMFAFQKGILNPARQEEGSFEAVKEAAFEGSDYDSSDEDVSDVAVGIVLILIAAVVIGIVVLVNRIRKKMYDGKIKKFAKKQNYFRDIPNDGNINATYRLGKEFQVCEDGAILATTMLRLVSDGCLEPVKTQGTKKEEVSLRLVKEPGQSADAYEEYLYTVLECAAGADGVLQKQELSAYFNEKPKTLRSFISKSESEGESYLRTHACFKGGISNRLSALTPSGEKELGELLGLKEYLLDFSLIGERNIQETIIWQDYMVYATLYGIADQVMKQLKNLCPQIRQELDVYEQNIYYANQYYLLTYQAMRRREEAEEQAKRSAGSGGSASFGGGGGSIGGGSGGGSR